MPLNFDPLETADQRRPLGYHIAHSILSFAPFKNDEKNLFPLKFLNIVISHFDLDHYNLIEHILDYFLIFRKWHHIQIKFFARPEFVPMVEEDARKKKNKKENKIKKKREDDQDESQEEEEEEEINAEEGFGDEKENKAESEGEWQAVRFGAISKIFSKHRNASTKKCYVFLTDNEPGDFPINDQMHFFNWNGEKTNNTDAPILIVGPKTKQQNENEYSLLVRIYLNGKKIVLLGDATNSVYKLHSGRIQSYCYPCDILLLSHHGAGTHKSNNPGLLNWLLPKKCIVSAPLFSAFNHPDSRVIQEVCTYFEDRDPTRLYKYPEDLEDLDKRELEDQLFHLLCTNLDYDPLQIVNHFNALDSCVEN